VYPTRRAAEPLGAWIRYEKALDELLTAGNDYVDARRPHARFLGQLGLPDEVRAPGRRLSVPVTVGRSLVCAGRNAAGVRDGGALRPDEGPGRAVFRRVVSEAPDSPVPPIVEFRTSS